MALPAVAGNTVYASDLFPIGQPSGGSDVGESFIGGWASTSGQTISTSTLWRSRISAPVGVTLGTAQNVSNINAPQTAHIDSNGCQIWATSSAGASNCFENVTWTVNY